MKEPASGFLLVGQSGSQQLYVRDDEEAVHVAKTRPGFTPEHRWFHIADVDDIYRYDDLLTDFGAEHVNHLEMCLCNFDCDHAH